MGQKEEEAEAWKTAILSTVRGASPGESRKKCSVELKKLRKQVFLALQVEDEGKSTKKLFKKCVKALEAEGKLEVDQHGIVSTKKEKKRKAGGTESESNKKLKKQKDEGDSADQDNEKDESFEQKTNDSEQQEKTDAQSEGQKEKPCKGNPLGITRLFLGNLPFAVDETSLGAFLDDTVTHIKWITDKETGKFYGSAFCEIDTAAHAAAAVAKAGSQLMGRPIKINYAPAREGDIWPPTKNVVSGGQAGGSGKKAMREKPDNCVKLFIGNLSYDIDDDTITKFFSNVDAEVKAVRWLHHRDSGDFKGCGYVEFWNSDACEKGATLNGKNLLGRPIRIDWTD